MSWLDLFYMQGENLGFLCQLVPIYFVIGLGHEVASFELEEMDSERPNWVFPLFSFLV